MFVLPDLNGGGKKKGDESQREHVEHMGVSKNRGTPKWMVYNGKPY